METASYACVRGSPFPVSLPRESATREEGSGAEGEIMVFSFNLLWRDYLEIAC
jgi:hypothetical protein